MRPQIKELYDIVKSLFSRVRVSSGYRPEVTSSLEETPGTKATEIKQVRKKRKVRTEAQKRNMTIDKLLERQQQRALYHYIHYLSMDSEFPPFPREGEDSDEERIQTQRRKWEMEHYGYTLSASSSLSYTSSSSCLLPFTSVVGTRKSAMVPQHPKAPLQVTALFSVEWDFDSSFNSLLDNDRVDEKEGEWNERNGEPLENGEKKE